MIREARAAQIAAELFREATESKLVHIAATVGTALRMQGTETADGVMGLLAAVATQIADRFNLNHEDTNAVIREILKPRS